MKLNSFTDISGTDDGGDKWRQQTWDEVEQMSCSSRDNSDACCSCSESSCLYAEAGENNPVPVCINRRQCWVSGTPFPVAISAWRCGTEVFVFPLAHARLEEYISVSTEKKTGNRWTSVPEALGHVGRQPFRPSRPNKPEVLFFLFKNLWFYFLFLFSLFILILLLRFLLIFV